MWQVKIKGLMMKKGLWSVVKDQGEEDVITTKMQASPFAQKDEKGLNTIITCLGDDYLHYLDDPKTAREAWATLESIQSFLPHPHDIQCTKVERTHS